MKYRGTPKHCDSRASERFIVDTTEADREKKEIIMYYEETKQTIGDLTKRLNTLKEFAEVLREERLQNALRKAHRYPYNQ